jgi:hypothetical protein
VQARKCHVKLQIPCIPEKDELQEACETSALIKLTLSTKVELWVSVWSPGTPKKFIMHIKQAITAIKAKGLQYKYMKRVQARKSAQRSSRQQY